MNASWLTNNIKAVLAIIVVVFGIAYFWMCSIRNIKPDPQILIAMVTSMSIVLSYFFGSSTKSEKTEPTITQTGDNPKVITSDRPDTTETSLVKKG